MRSVSPILPAPGAQREPFGFPLISPRTLRPMSRPRISLLAVLAGREHDYEHTARPLLHALDLTHHFELEVVSDLGAANAEQARVVIAASDVPMERSQAERLVDFVRRGGGLILLHSTLATWSQDPSVAGMAGWIAGGPGPMTELVVKTVTGHPLTERLPAEIVIEDELYLSEGPPAGADVLLRASWRFTEPVVAYTRAVGEGRFVHVGLVVVGTPPSAHAGPVIEALSAGKHVVCEKPFAIRVEEVDRMMDAAAAYQRVLTVYQSRRWDPDFIALRDTVAGGGIGELFYMESFIGGYSHPCDYWHSHEPISGGTIYDWGSHYFDWVLQLFGGQVTAVSAVAHKRVWHDVTNADQVRVDLTFGDGAQASFMQSDIAAALKPKWYLLGTRGAIVGEWRHETIVTRGGSGELVEDRPAPADLPAQVVVSRPAAGGLSEERLALPVRDEHGFYRNLADHLAWDEKLAVTPSEARRTVAVMEAATESIARGGARLEVHI